MGWESLLGDAAKVGGLLDPFTGPPEMIGLGVESARDSGGPKEQSYQPVELVHPAQEKVEAARGQADEQKEAELQADKNQLTEINSSPWTTAANALSQSFQQDMSQVQDMISGAAEPGAEQTAASEAAGDLNLPSMSPGAAWLAQGASDAAAQTQGVAGAMNAEGNAYAAAAGPISKAITQWGQDNAIQNMTAPEGAFLNALISHVNSNISYYGGIAPAQVPEIEQMPTVVQAFQQAGGGTSGSGLIPLTEAKVSNTGQVNVPSAASSLAGSPTLTPSFTTTSTNAGAG